MPACEGCGEHITGDFARVFGNNDGEVYVCMSCWSVIDIDPAKRVGLQKLEILQLVTCKTGILFVGGGWWGSMVRTIEIETEGKQVSPEAGESVDERIRKPDKMRREMVNDDIV